MNNKKPIFIGISLVLLSKALNMGSFGDFSFWAFIIGGSIILNLLLADE